MQRKSKVLFITHYGEMYGANRSLIDLIVQLNNKYDLEPIVLCNQKGDLTDNLELLGIEYYLYKFKICFEHRWESRNFLFHLYHDLRHLLTAIRKWFQNYSVTRAIIKSQILSDIKVIFSNSSVITIGEDLSRILQIPHIHSIKELPSKQFNLKADFGDHFYYKKLRSSNVLIFNSEYTKKEFFRDDFTQNALVVYDDILKPILNTKISLPKNKFSVGVFGYLSSQKNQMDAIEALAYIDDNVGVNLYLIGGGDKGKYLERAKELGVIDRLFFIDYTDNIGGYYNALDAVIVCSKNEALGRVTIEAMLSKKPVIGKNSGATPELIEIGKNGLMYNTPKELACRIIEIRDNKNIREKISQGGFDFAVTNFSSGRSTEKVYNEIKELIANE